MSLCCGVDGATPPRCYRAAMSDLRGTMQDAARGSALSQPKVFVLTSEPPPDIASMLARHHVPLMEDTLVRLCVHISPSAYPEAQGTHR